MGDLWDGIIGFFGNIRDQVMYSQVGFWLDRYQTSKCVVAVEHWWLVTPPWVKAWGGVEDYKILRVEELTEAGMIEIIDTAGGAFSMLANDLVKGFGKLAPEMELDFEKKTKETIVKGSPGITDVFKDKIGFLFDAIFDGVDPEGKKIPEDMRKNIKDTMMPMLGMGVTFGVGTALAELIHPTKEMGWGRISHFLYDTVGFKAFMDAYIDPIRMNLILQPTKYSINELTTPFIPRWADVMEWYGRGHVDEAEMVALRKKHGIEDGWDYRYQRMGTKPSSYFMLNAIGKEGFWDPDDFLFWLSDAGYGAFQITEDMLTPYEKEYNLKPPSTTQLHFLLDAYKHMNIRMAIGDVRAMRKTLFTEGWITREEFEKDLVKAKILPEDMIDPLDAIEQLQATKDKKELAKAYERKYLYGRIEKDKLEKKLIELGYREGWVTAHVQYLFTRKEGKLAVDDKEKVLSDGKIINAYKYGQKDKGWCMKELDDKGYSTEDAVLLTEAIDQGIKNDAVDEWIRAHESRTLYGRMTINELKGKYVELGKTADWAEARAAYMEERLMGKEEVEE